MRFSPLVVSMGSDRGWRSTISSFIGYTPSDESGWRFRSSPRALLASSIIIVNVLFPCSEGPIVTIPVFLYWPSMVFALATLKDAWTAKPLFCLTKNMAIDKGPILCSPA